MCSTWAPTVRGDRPSEAAIASLVWPSATSRAISNSRAVSGRHGSSSAPRLRTIALSSSARFRSGRLPSPLREGLDLAQRLDRLGLAVRAQQAAARSSLAQAVSHVRPSASHPAIAASSEARAATVGAGARPQQALGMVERRPRQPVPAREEGGHLASATAPRRRVAGPRARHGRR